MTNKIDLGELQDDLDNCIRKHKASVTNLTKAKNTLQRAEDMEATWRGAVHDIKSRIADAARALTK